MATVIKNRSKPRSRHVRTGCVTCKRRRVKCDEGKPFCTRCYRGAFKCDGYDVPRTWLFEGSNRPTEESFVPRDESSNLDSALLDANSQNASFACTPSLSTCLQYGNSDPFGSCAIPIKPFEHRYITYYREQIIPELYHLYLRKWMNVMASDDWNHCVNSLNDETAAYGLLARNVAIDIVLSQGSNASPSTLLLYYLTKTQASLRKKLMAMTDNETPQSIYPVMWTTFFLGFAELLVKAPTTIFHVTALSRLVMRYVEAIGPDLDRNALLYLVYVDVQRSCVTLTRPVFDFFLWFPRLYEGDWALARQKVHIPPNAISTEIHPDIKDEIIRAMIRVKREGQYIYRDLMGSCFDIEESPIISLSIHSRNLLFQGQVVNIAIDTLDKADQLPSDSLEGQEANARAFIALADLYWGRFASQAPVAGKLLFDDAPTIIPCLQSVLMRTKLQQQQPSSCTEELNNGSVPVAYADARLWALFVGSQVEQYRQDILGFPKLCGNWFVKEFRAQAKSMGFTSWEAIIPILDQFLYTDKLKPHISQWWQEPNVLDNLNATNE